MILTGLFDSPFVRRVAITLNLLEIPFERRAISAFADFSETLQINPLGKVPALELDHGEVLFDSEAILDHIDELAGPERALTPPSGEKRRLCQRRTVVALGLADKMIGLRGELYRRREGSQDQAVVDRFEAQIHSALDWLEESWSKTLSSADWPDQAAITTAVAVTFMKNKRPTLFKSAVYTNLGELNRTLEGTPAFIAAPFPPDMD